MTIDFSHYLALSGIAGCDEVGRGPLVGDVVAAAVVLDPSKPIAGLADSKKLTEKKRLALYEQICRDAAFFAVGRASVAEIDRLNILHASMLAMQRAIMRLDCEPSEVLVDGNIAPDVPYPCTTVVKGDDKVAAISAASIVAKVVRDSEMLTLDEKHPEYGFAKHKGYPTKAHFAALEAHGVLPEHRKSFKPVQRIIQLSAN